MKRRATGLALVLAAGIAAAGAVSGCSHDAKPAQPEPPPLPPASGTPIGYLVDDATELKLTDTQLAHLKSIDDDLAAKLASLDGELRGASPSASPSQNPGRRRGRGGGMRGGVRGGGMRGGANASGNAAGSGAGSGATNPPSRRARPDVTARVTEERAARVRDAIDRALGELDVVQRIVARRVLAEHGVDLDAGRPATGSQAKPGTLTEPSESDEEPDDSGDSDGSNRG